MKYIIMCGGSYDFFNIPKQFIKINNERLIDRTIRLLKENNIKDINISTNNMAFKSCGVPLLINENNEWTWAEGKWQKGHWLDAYYPVEESCVYLYGDVYYSENAIKTIITKANEISNKNILFGSAISANQLGKNWGEPFAYIVNNMEPFRVGINIVKKMEDEGKIARGFAITWELYRYLNNLDINVQKVLVNDTFFIIDDETNDVDNEKDIQIILDKIKGE